MVVSKSTPKSIRQAISSTPAFCRLARKSAHVCLVPAPGTRLTVGGYFLCQTPPNHPGARRLRRPKAAWRQHKVVRVSVGGHRQVDPAAREVIDDSPLLGHAHGMMHGQYHAAALSLTRSLTMAKADANTEGLGYSPPKDGNAVPAATPP